MKGYFLLLQFKFTPLSQRIPVFIFNLVFKKPIFTISKDSKLRKKTHTCGEWSAVCSILKKKI